MKSKTIKINQYLADGIAFGVSFDPGFKETRRNG
jgi:hypothetical protein